jgi:integrase
LPRLGDPGTRPAARCTPEHLGELSLRQRVAGLHGRRRGQADGAIDATVEMLLRMGLRVSEYTSLQADAVVQIGAAPWLHVPVGKLREDRYLPLHPHLVALIDDYRARYVNPANPLLLPRENGKPAGRHAVTRSINKAAPQHAATGESHDQLDKDHPHNAE